MMRSSSCMNWHTIWWKLPIPSSGLKYVVVILKSSLRCTCILTNEEGPWEEFRNLKADDINWTKNRIRWMNNGNLKELSKTMSDKTRQAARKCVTFRYQWFIHARMQSSCTDCLKRGNFLSLVACRIGNVATERFKCFNGMNLTYPNDMLNRQGVDV